MLRKGLQIRGFRESVADPCVFIKESASIVEADSSTSDLTRGAQTNGLVSTAEATSTSIRPASIGEAGTGMGSTSIAEVGTYKSSASVAEAGSTIDHMRNFRENSSDIIILVYVDDCIILSRNVTSIDSFIATLTHGPENFVFTDEGTVDKYLGVEISRLSDGTGFELTQPFLIHRILEAANIDTRMTNSRPTPVVGPLLSRDEDGPERKHD